MSVVQSAMFLFSFRYVFGGAIDAGAASYVDFPCSCIRRVDRAVRRGRHRRGRGHGQGRGFTDRLLSLPVSRYALMLGRTVADATTNVWSIVTTAPNAQAAQGMSLVALVFAFISSAYVPAISMPGWLQPLANISRPCRWSMRCARFFRALPVTWVWPWPGARSWLLSSRRWR